MSIIYFYIYILIINIVKLEELDECPDKLDCINCTFLVDCYWRNNECINITKEKNVTLDLNSNNTNFTNFTKQYRLFETNNQTTIFNNFKYLKNSCYYKTFPYADEDKYLYDKLEKYCGKKDIIITYEMLINGYEIKLNNVDGKYGYPHILCQYNFYSGNGRHDVDIYINKSLIKDFLFIFSYDYYSGKVINYTSTITLYSVGLRTVSFWYYSNRSFDSAPFIIYFKDYKYPSYSILDYLFLSFLIASVIIIIASIIYVRYNSKFFFKNKKKYEEITNESSKNKISINKNELNLSEINEKKSDKNDEQEKK